MNVQVLNTCRILLAILVVFIVACEPLEQQKSSIIIKENLKEGTEDWIITKVNMADTCKLDYEEWMEMSICRNTQIEGYVSHTSIKSGDTLKAYISVNPVSTFTVDFYRMGYYGGKGGRHMMSMGPMKATTQKTPEDGENYLIECKWTETFDLIIPDDWVSGVYLGKLTATEGGWQSYIIFIVKDGRSADFNFQCSDLTWQAYNRWPAWRSLYDYELDWGHSPWYTDIGPEVGFDRPYSIFLNRLPVSFLPINNGSGEFLMWELPLAYWMESEGYDVTYTSNLDTHADREGLLRTKGFLSVGHDEYWSPQMVDNVTNARDKGVNIAFLSGNAVDGGIEIKPSGSGTANRVFGRVGEFDDENKLMGSTSYGVGFMDWKCVAPEHWLFQGTGMKKGDGIVDLVGWEYHGYPLADIPGIKILAEGLPEGVENDEEGFAATYYETPKGNFVFNAGTCWWSMRLSTPPAFPHPLNPEKSKTGHAIDFRENDSRLQKITKNLFDRISNSNIQE